MTKYALWYYRIDRKECFAILHDEAILQEHVRLMTVAPPVKIKEEHEELSLEELEKLYPYPAPADMPKAKRVD